MGWRERGRGFLGGGGGGRSGGGGGERWRGGRVREGVGCGLGGGGGGGRQGGGGGAGGEPVGRRNGGCRKIIQVNVLCKV